MAAPLLQPSPDRLAELRTRLDAVDAGLHRLLRERFDLVAEIGAAKGPDEPIIRPAREAAVLENRLAMHTGAMPAATLAYLFRAVIGGACSAQRPFAVHVVGALEAARFLYGPVPALAHERAAEAVAALAGAPRDVAVIDEAAPGEPWWEDRGEAHVIGRCATSCGAFALVLGGAEVARGTGPMALVLREGGAGPRPVRASDIADEDDVLGRFHPFPLTIPVAR